MSESRLELVWSRDGADPSGPFQALLEAADENPEAAEGLALAYASMERDERARLVSTIVDEGEARQRSVAGPLALLLAVEEDRALAGEIARGLDGTLARRGVDGGWAWGDRDEGGTVLVRHLHGRFVEVLGVRWDATSVTVDAAPLARHDDLWIRDHHGVPEAAERIPLSHAIDALAAALWRARQAGVALPPRLRAFAHVFTVDAAPTGGEADAAVDEPPSDGVD